MKKFAISVLTISLCFVGLGTLMEQVGAKLKSDEKALDIVRKARTAIGGEAALAEVRSLVITGRSVHTVRIGDQERSEPGESEIAIQFPNKLSQKVMIGKPEGAGARIVTEQNRDVVIVSKKGDGSPIELKSEGGEFTTADGKKLVIKERVGDNAFSASGDARKIVVHRVEGGPSTEIVRMSGKEGGPEKFTIHARGGHPGVGMKQNELLRLSLALLLTAPEGMDVSYTFAGESDIDGTPVNIVNAEFGGSNYKLFIGKSNNLPVAMSYRGMPVPKVVKFTRGDAPASADAPSDYVVSTNKTDAGHESMESLVKFSDYRSAGGVQLPYKWTTSVGGSVREVLDVTTFDINPANIAEKFADQKVFVRTKKTDGQ